VTRWLNAKQQRNWRSFLSVAIVLPDIFSKDLQDAHDLTLSDYEILVRLSESPDRCMRMSELAERVMSSRSRLTHQFDRLIKAGLVSRTICEEDKRGFNAVLTEAGFNKLVEAAPLHVESVRGHLVDVLSDEEFAKLGEISRKIFQALDPAMQRKIMDGLPEEDA
jgi:DNA-binding MarR family transcriptional regulator